MSIPGGDDPKKAPKAKNNICIVSNHNRKLGWRLPEIYFNSKENPNGRIFLFQKIFRQMWKTVNMFNYNRLDLPFPEKIRKALIRIVILWNN